MWSELKRIIKPRGAIVFTASQPFTSALVMSNPSWFRHEWIWHKNKASGYLNAKKAPMKAHENIVVFSEKAPFYNPQMTTGHNPVSAFYTRHNGQNYGEGDSKVGGGSTVRYPRSVQDFPVVNNDDLAKVHPTQKPVALFEYLINTYTRENETVLDFCMGSGTTGEACKKTNRNFIGIEKDFEMFTIAEKRISDL
jgi:site-specific DNA-methyltransferase (adenine-specific)